MATEVFFCDTRPIPLRDIVPKQISLCGSRIWSLCFALPLPNPLRANVPKQIWP